MRLIFILFLPFVFTFNLQAQIIYGTIKNNKGTYITGATISLLKATDSSIIKLALSDDKGVFLFSNVTPGDYFINASFVGYKNHSTNLLSVKAADINLGDLLLEEGANQLKAVVVTTKKALIQVKGDKTILNVEGTINSTGNNTLELMRKSPGVTVNGDDRISMNGKTGVQIFIDGRPSPLSGSDLTAYLKSLSSSEVEAIELIANPSAKYEAAGTGGIINIRLKKNKSFGTNETINFDYNQGMYSRFNNGISLNHRSRKLNIFGSYNYNTGTYRKVLKMDRYLSDSGFIQSGVLLSKNRTHNLKAGIDYFINKNSTIGIVTNGNFNNSPFSSSSRTLISFQPTMELNRTLVAQNNSSTGKKNMDFNLNYFYANTEGKSLNINADYGFYNITNNQLQPNLYYNKQGVVTGLITYEMYAPAHINIYTLKGDYEQPFMQGKLEMGVKSSYVTSDNDFKRYNVYETATMLDPINSNHFIYKENINAAYINYSRTYKKITIDAGLRTENTNVTGLSAGAKKQAAGNVPFDSSFSQNYLNLFPAVAVNYAKNHDSHFRLSINRRIDRPAYQDLNPFEIKIDDYLIQKGNSYLRPQYTTGLALSWVFKQKLTSSMQYNYIKNISSWITDTTETSKSLLIKRNLANQKLVTLNISYPVQYKNYSLFANLTSSYTSYNANFGNGRTINEGAFGINFYLQNSFKFGNKWSAELTGFYNSPTVQEGNMRVKSIWSVDAGVQTRILAEKLTLKFAVSDIFQSLRFSYNSEFAGQKAFYLQKWNSQQAKLSLVFRLGSNSVKGARQRKAGAEEEMKRVQ